MQGTVSTNGHLRSVRTKFLCSRTSGSADPLLRGRQDYSLAIRSITARSESESADHAAVIFPPRVHASWVC